MNILQYLGLTSGWVPNKKDIDFCPETTLTSLRELLVGASEQLTQNTLLDILLLPYGGCEWVHKLLIDVGLWCQSQQPSLDFLALNCTVIWTLVLFLPRSNLLVGYDIHVGIVDGFQDSLEFTLPDSLCSVHASHSDTITRFNWIHVIIISHQGYCLWRIPFRYIFLWTYKHTSILVTPASWWTVCPWIGINCGWSRRCACLYIYRKELVPPLYPFRVARIQNWCIERTWSMLTSFLGRYRSI